MGLDAESGADGGLQVLLDRVHAGDPAAQDALIRLVKERYQQRVHLKLQKDNPRVAWFERTDDVLEEVLVRLLNLLRTRLGVVPAGFAEFERWLPAWVAMNLRFVLTDMARKHLGVNDRARLEHAGEGKDRLVDPTSGPGGERARVHFFIGLLPDKMRRLIDLRFYVDASDAEIGRQIEVPRSKIPALERQALALLGKWLREGYRDEGPAQGVPAAGIPGNPRRPTIFPPQKSGMPR